MSYATAEEAQDSYQDSIAEQQHVIDECEVALGSLNAASDYIENVIAERESGDLLPSASSLDVDLGYRVLLISDRIGEREDMKSRAEWSIVSLEEELELVLEEIADREADEGDDELDDMENIDG